MNPMRRPVCLALAAGLVAVLGAGAPAGPQAAAQETASTCAERIARMKSLLDVQVRETDAAPVLEKGTAIEEEGGTTVYAETGPATPRENWFGDSPDTAGALLKLEGAIAARERGDVETCHERLDEARLLLAD